MRISDWSSDVCSSDLQWIWTYPSAWAYPGDAASWPHETGGTPQPRRSGSNPGGRQPLGTPGASWHRLVDRKSVVSGKSVSVRVDLGGRRIIKNTKSINTCTLW